MKRIILPDEKLNSLAEELAQKLYESRYFANGVIKGEELKTCTPYAQINKFLLFQLFQVLNQQMQKLKHPYFDFEEADVQGLMTQLQNQLSRHIKIEQEDFRPLLKKAVYNNLKLILDPIDTLGNFFFHNQDKVSLETYEKYAPFFTDFDFAVNSILRYHQKNNMKIVEKDIFFVKLHRVVAIFNSSGEKDIEGYRNDIFQRLTGRNIQDVVVEAQQDAEEKRLAELRSEEEKAQAIAAEKRRLEEEENQKIAAAKAAEEARLQEEEARKKAEEERIAAEVERLRKEEEERKAKELSFFDTLTQPQNFFEISDDGDAEAKVEQDEVIEIGTELSASAPILAENETEKTEEVSENRSVYFELEDDEVPAIQENTPEIETPAIEENTPEIAVPEIEMPAIAENTPEIAVPEIEMPAIEENTPEIAVPEIETPAIEENTPEIAAPEIETPAIEENTPEITAPEIEMPAIEENMPEITAPEIETPEIAAPEIEVREIEEYTPAISEPEMPVTEEQPIVSLFDQFFSKKAQAPASNEDGETLILANQLQNEENEAPKSLVESLMSDAPTHLINTLHASQKIKLEDIPIHKQYLYVQRVFTGNNVRFRIIIDKANNANVRQEIEEIIEKYILSNPDIREKDPVVEEFLTLLRSRFTLGR